MDFTPIKDVEVAEFLKKARKGLRYGEDVFLCIYTYKEDAPTEGVVRTFFENILKNEEDRHPYGKFLFKKGILGDMRARISMPGFSDGLKELLKELMYRTLAMHIPSSDFFDLVGWEIETRIFQYRLIKEEGFIMTSEESGNLIYVFVHPRKELAVLHTIFN